MKIYTLEELRQSNCTIMNFLIGRFESGKLIVNDKLLADAITYHRKNSKSLINKSNAKLRQIYYKELVTLNNTISK